jgi:hypothetical protein
MGAAPSMHRAKCAGQDGAGSSAARSRIGLETTCTTADVNHWQDRPLW